MMPMAPQPNNLSEINRKFLCKADYSFSESFVLKIADHPEPFIGEKIARIIPGKRLVVFGHWKKQAVVAKIFFSRQAKEHMQRDARGAEALLRCRIPSPAIYYQGPAQDPKIQVILFEHIASAQNLDDFWQEHQNSPKSEPVLNTLILELATQHVMGLLQEDLHLKNFLLAKEKIYTLDGADIRIHSGPLTKKQSIENLALLFSQLGMHTHKLQQRLFDAYIKARSWVLEKSDLQLLQKNIRQWHISRWSYFSKKIFRSSSQFKNINTWGSHIVYNRNYDSPDFQQFLHNPDAYFSHSETKILKAGRSATVAKMQIGSHILVIKRYNIKDFFHHLKRCLKPSRAITSWRLAHQLQFVGIPTANPVAVIEQSFLGLKGKTYFVMEYIESTPAYQFFDDPDIDIQQKTIIAKRIIITLFNLARLQLSHGDLKITNILLNKNLEPVLIDLDGMREHKSSLSFWNRFRKDMERFLHNWQDKPKLRELFQQIIKGLDGC
jgi:tRNA A-37 threonylcarbamoyl transferase component Bud32